MIPWWKPQWPTVGEQLCWALRAVPPAARNGCANPGPVDRTGFSAICAICWNYRLWTGSAGSRDMGKDDPLPCSRGSDGRCSIVQEVGTALRGLRLPGIEKEDLRLIDRGGDRSGTDDPHRVPPHRPHHA